MYSFKTPEGCSNSTDIAPPQTELTAQQQGFELAT